MALVCPSCGKENPDEARFCLACGTPIEVAEPDETRRHVTLLFMDLAGSTALAERSDPETVRRVMSRYFDEMRSVIEVHGGTVEKFVGDAVMAAFGIPELHEDDAVRAVRAAAEMRERLSGLNEEFEALHGITLGVRTGVNTGEVIAGDVSRGETFATGDAVNVAARLEQAAPPGEIYVGDQTYRLVRDAVVAERVEPLELKGKTERLPAWRLLEVKRRTAGIARRADSQLVGRDRELALLEETLDRVVRDRRCQLVSVLGEPGAGKSRLVAEFVTAAKERASVLEGTCLPYGDGITFWPVIEMITRAAEIDETDSAEDVRRKLGALLPEDDQRPLIADQLASLFGAAETAGALQELLWAIRRLLEALSAERPLVAVFDDVHWAEPSLLDLLEYVLGWSAGAPILLVCLARQELLETRPLLVAPRPNASSIVLEPLAPDAIESLIENLIGDDGLTRGAYARIAEAAEGNPLFLEELVRMLVEDKALAGGDGDGARAEELRVPPTIHALLAARLDRLEDHERDVVRRASVIGRVFWWGALAELSPQHEHQRIPSALQSLVRKEVITPDAGAFAGEDAFRFGHQLIRDTAYEGLRKEQRADLHERFAGWLENRVGERIGEYQEIVGYHLEQAWRYGTEIGRPAPELLELARRGASHILAAGRRALARGDAHAASSLLGRGAALLPADDPDRVDAFLDLHHARRWIGDFEATADALEHARLAATTPQDEAQVELARLMFETLAEPEFDLEELERAAESALTLFEQSGDDAGLVEAWLAVAEAHLTRCNWNPTLDALERARVHAERAGELAEHVVVLTHIANALYWGPTSVDEGIQRCQRLLDEAGGRRTVEANVLCYLGGFSAMKGDFDAARNLVARGRAIFGELGVRYGVANASLVGGPSELLAGEPAAAQEILRDAYRELDEIGETGVLSTISAMLAEALLESGDYDEAERQVTATEALAPEDDVATQVIMRTVKARLLARRGAHGAAEELAREAVDRVLQTDFLDLQGSALMAFAEVLRMGGDTSASAAQIERALAAFDQKGNVVSAGRARAGLEALREPDPA